VQAFADECLGILGKPAIGVLLGDLVSGEYPARKSRGSERISDLVMQEIESAGKEPQSPPSPKENINILTQKLPAEHEMALIEILNSVSPQQNDDFKSKVESLMNFVQQQAEEEETRKLARAARRAAMSPEERKAMRAQRRPVRDSIFSPAYYLMFVYDLLFIFCAESSLD